MGKQCSKELSVHARSSSGRGDTVWVAPDSVVSEAERPSVSSSGQRTAFNAGSTESLETGKASPASGPAPAPRRSSVSRFLKTLTSRPAGQFGGSPEASGPTTRLSLLAAREVSPGLHLLKALGPSGSTGPTAEGIGPASPGGEKPANASDVVVARTESFQQPPHFLEMKEVEELSKTFTFYVEIFGIKCRNVSLSSRSSQHLGSRLFCSVNWADLAFYETTEAVACVANPKWASKYHFTWSIPQLSRLHEQSLELSVYEEEGFPTHGMSSPQAQSRRVLLGSASVDLLTVATGPVHHDLLLSHPEKGKTDCGRVMIDVRMAQICPLIINPIEILVNLHEPTAGQAIIEEAVSDEEDAEGEEPRVAPFGPPRVADPLSSTHDAEGLTRSRDSQQEPDESEGLARAGVAEGKSPLMNKELWQQQEVLRLRAAQTPRASEKPDAQFGDPVKTLGWLRDGGLAEEDEDCLRREDSTAPHDEEPGPLMAHWQLCFRPTGVKNPAEYFSTWTDKVDRPYWNTVDHSLLTGRCTSAVISTPSFGRQPSSASSAGVPVGAVKRASEGEAAAGEELGDEAGVSRRPSSEIESVSAASSVSQATQPSLVSCASRSHCMDRVDQLGTYQKLAALARKGRLVKEVLYDDFPTIQLVTTIDQLRHNHLHIALYSRCFPHDEPKFMGESWLPFFKIYDADVVDQLEKHFFDSFFREKLWLDGRCIGDIEGIIVFQNNPMMRQMYAGVHTERGFMRISPPILGAEQRTKFHYQRAKSVPPEIQKIAELHKTLLDLLFSKAQHSPQEILLNMGVGGLLAVVGAHRQKPQAPDLAQPGSTPTPQMVFLSDAKREQVSTEFQSVCEQLLLLLSSSEAETRRSFIYRSVQALLTAQRVLLSLANHVLEYMDYVLWQHRGLYCSILHHILRRGELDIGTVLPPQGICSSLLPGNRLDLAEVYILYRFVRRSSKLFTRASFGSVSSCGEDDDAVGADGKALGLGSGKHDEGRNFGLIKAVRLRKRRGETRGSIRSDLALAGKSDHLLDSREDSTRPRAEAEPSRDPAVPSKEEERTEPVRQGGGKEEKAEERTGEDRSDREGETDLEGEEKRPGEEPVFSTLSELHAAEEYCVPNSVKYADLDEEEEDEEEDEDGDLFRHFLTTAGSPKAGAEGMERSEKKQGATAEAESEETPLLEAAPRRSGSPTTGQSPRSEEHQQRVSTVLLSSAGASLRAALAELGLKPQAGTGDPSSEPAGEERREDLEPESSETQSTLVFAAGAGEGEKPELTGKSGSGVRALERGVTASDRLRTLAALARSLPAEKKDLVVVHHKHMKICRQYFLLLHRMLFYALNNFCTDAIFEGQKKYISVFLSIAYFRLPGFREELLDCLLTAEEREMDIEEWRGTEYLLDAQSLKKMEKWNRHCELRISLDWSAFHAYVKSYFGETALADALSRLRDKTVGDLPLEWKGQFAQRGALFFCFLEQWCRHVFQSSPTPEALTWQQLPGYAILLKALLLEMKLRPVTKYPDSLLNSSGAMLANEKLLSVFSKVLFLKTSVYNSPAVFAALNYVDYWMEVLKIRGQELPTSFDFNFLKKGLDIVVACDICVNAAKAVWFVYKNLPLFHREHLRSIVVDLMLHNYFLHLFLNWSWLVRKSYMWFLLYRLCEGARKIVTRTNTATAANAAAVNALLQTLSAPPKREDEKSRESVAAAKPSERADDPPGPAGPQEGDPNVLKLQAELVASIRLSPEERIVFQGYMVLASFLKRLNAPLVLPGFATKLIAHVLELQRQGQNPTLPSLQPTAGRRKFRYNPTPGWTPDAPAPADTAEPTGPAAGSEGDTASLAAPSGGPDDLEPNAPATGDSDEAAALPSEPAGSPGKPTQPRKSSVDRTGDRGAPAGASGRAASPNVNCSGVDLSSAGGNLEDIDLRLWAEGLVELPRHLQVYAKIAVKEWHAEVSAYREWVMAGASPLPAMHIPAAPLDSNTDVPLDS
ncbi:hypothetical protein TGME49_269990 [Toxoplasma gondii ME49]|uniref:C2 domain-containing protein n=1 Tax=Toxoplasma gondii (strain ATCC 50611 / Me49) TaxID=508771 RepID=S8G9G7_TOXGM|nr:hypothetical protein TGME49_269990 [Toxoplasma gondii ME49]EPT28380.1 hypothetical protein TGME49_269990 [Toxoplasma gondii ME49]|eukprot:XP_002365677.1 hypothetical protein TGME49_269990 [Toxoplasma gondii ME49]